jgi:hypothetical protein
VPPRIAPRLAQDLIAPKLLAPTLAEEPGELGQLLELGYVAIEEDPVQATVLEDHVRVK